MRSLNRQAGNQEKAVVGRRYFNVIHAERALVLVRRIVADMVGWYDRLLELQEAFEAADAGGADREISEGIKSEMSKVAEKLHSCMLELDDVGAEVKDWEAGVVDFPCVAGGREVRLCWQYGQDRICYWHDIHACPGGRKPIETLPVADSIKSPA